MVMVWIWAKLSPELASPTEAVTWRERTIPLQGTRLIILLFIIVTGGIFLDIVTLTEVAAVDAKLRQYRFKSHQGARTVECNDSDVGEAFSGGS